MIKTEQILSLVIKVRVNTGKPIVDTREVAPSCETDFSSE